MRLFVSSFVVALMTMVGAALAPASAATAGVANDAGVKVSQSAVQKATYWGHRRGFRRHYGWRGYGWRPYRYGWRGYGWRGRHYGWRHRGWRHRGWRHRGFRRHW